MIKELELSNLKRKKYLRIAEHALKSNLTVTDISGINKISYWKRELGYFKDIDALMRMFTDLPRYKQVNHIAKYINTLEKMAGNKQINNMIKIGVPLDILVSDYDDILKKKSNYILNSIKLGNYFGFSRNLGSCWYTNMLPIEFIRTCMLKAHKESSQFSYPKLSYFKKTGITEDRIAIEDKHDMISFWFASYLTYMCNYIDLRSKDIGKSEDVDIIISFIKYLESEIYKSLDGDRVAKPRKLMNYMLVNEDFGVQHFYF